MTGKTRADLPTVTAEEAHRRGLWTLRQFAEWAGLTMSSAYRISAKEGFPEPVAAILTSGSALMRDAATVKEWFQDWSQHKTRQAKIFEKIASLPQITAEEADRRGLWTARQVAEWAGLAVKTVYEIFGKEGAPEPVAAILTGGPSPQPVRDRDVVKEWVEPRLRALASWTDGAEEINQHKANGVPSILSITTLCDATGLKKSTVKSYILRTGSTVRGAMAHLMRPAYRVGSTPYWSQAQLDAYQQAAEQERQRREALLAKLPEVTVEEAQRRELWSMRQLARWAGFAPVTFHRMANEEGFPEPVAVVPSSGTRPFVLRDRAAVEKFLRARRPDWQPVSE